MYIIKKKIIIITDNYVGRLWTGLPSCEESSLFVLTDTVYVVCLFYQGSVTDLATPPVRIFSVNITGMYLIGYVKTITNKHR